MIKKEQIFFQAFRIVLIILFIVVGKEKHIHITLI